YIVTVGGNKILPYQDEPFQSPSCTQSYTYSASTAPPCQPSSTHSLPRARCPGSPARRASCPPCRISRRSHGLRLCRGGLVFPLQLCLLRRLLGGGRLRGLLLRYR